MYVSIGMEWDMIDRQVEKNAHFMSGMVNFIPMDHTKCFAHNDLLTAENRKKDVGVWHGVRRR